MAESYGFFDAMYDAESDAYDRIYLAEQFANYFKLLVGNGVFESPTNQLKVVASGTGLFVNVTAGWAFINGYWFHNDAPRTIQLLDNLTSYDRTDYIRLKLSVSKRTIEFEVVSDDSNIIRNDTTFELELARVLVRPNMIIVSNANITDSRPDELRCGFVKGLIEVETTKDLFLQYNTIFNEWFNDVKGQLSGDLAVTVLNELGDVSSLETESKNVAGAINELLNIANGKMNIEAYDSNGDGKVDLADKADTLNGMEVTVDELNYLKGINSNIKEQLDKMVDTDKDFVLSNLTFSFSSKTCTINDERITADSLADVYFNSASIDKAIAANISVETYAGYVRLTAEKDVSGSLGGSIKIRVV